MARTKMAGLATELGLMGADAILIETGALPTYYITKDLARKAGWKSWKGNLDDVLPGKMIGGDVYQNREEKLPIESGRIWYEANINYKDGFRNRERILYSNDGLIFVSYDHYQTFYEVTYWKEQTSMDELKHIYTIDFTDVKQYLQMHQVIYQLLLGQYHVLDNL